MNFLFWPNVLVLPHRQGAAGIALAGDFPAPLLRRAAISRHPDHRPAAGDEQFVTGESCTPAQYARS